MNAVCFKCGKTKYDPFDPCTRCSETPMKQQDKVYSVVLSTECISKKKLVWAQNYIKTKGKLPVITDSLLNKAKRLVEQSFVLR